MRILNLALAGLFSLSLAAQAPKAEKKAPAAASASAFIGNKDSKVFHKADCKVAAKMKSENKVSFASKAEAEKAGYKPCKVCKADA